MSAAVEYLKSAIEYAPKKTGPIAPLLRGWWLTVNEGEGEVCYYVCAECAARIMARGCQLPGNPQPVWRDRAEPFGVCCVCQ